MLLFFKKAGLPSPFLAPSIVALVVVLYVCLLPAGHWSGDDYVAAWLAKTPSWASFLAALRWAPRPIPQALLAIYYALANHFHKPLIEQFLGTLWAASLAIIVIAGKTAGLQRPIFVAFTLFALTLLLSAPDEIFYWTSAAASYLPCWTGLAAATLLQRPATPRRMAVLTFSLLLATLSSEIAAVTMLAYATIVALMALRHGVSRLFWALIGPAACAGLVCLAILLGRMHLNTEVVNATSGLAGHWLPSIAAALPTFMIDIIGVPGMALPLGIACKLLLCCGLSLALKSSGQDARLRLAWASALLIGAFSTLVLAYHQFGVLCCDRHVNLRQGMILLAMASISDVLIGWRASLRDYALTAALGLLLIIRSPAILHDWNHVPLERHARKMTWHNASLPGDSMLFIDPPAEMITGRAEEGSGTYHRRDEQPWADPLSVAGHWNIWAIMAYFGKHDITIKPAD